MVSCRVFLFVCFFFGFTGWFVSRISKIIVLCMYQTFKYIYVPHPVKQHKITSFEALTTTRTHECIPSFLNMFLEFQLKKTSQ